MTESTTPSLKSVRLAKFSKMLAKLPDDIQQTAEDLFDLFYKDPMDPMLRNKPVYDSSKGRHRASSRSVQVTLRYRAVYVVDNGEDGNGDDQYCWYWIGSREDYGTFIGCR